MAQVVVQNVSVQDLHPAPWNPRFIKRERLDNLKESLENDPDFMWKRPILARVDGTIYAGNQRYRACVELGWRVVPAIISDIGEQLAKERGLRDNNAWGEWDDEALIQMVQDLAVEDRGAVESIGFTETQLRTILAESAAATPAPRDVVHREPTRYEDDDTADHTALQAPLPDDGDAWKEGTIRQFVLQYKAEQYTRVVAQLDALRTVLDIDNNTDVVTRVLEEYHAANVAGSA